MRVEWERTGIDFEPGANLRGTTLYETNRAVGGIEWGLWRKKYQIGARRLGRLCFEGDGRRCPTTWTLPLWAEALPGFRQQRGWPSWLRRKPFCWWRQSASATEPAGGREAWLWHKRRRAICRDWEMC